MERLLVSPTKSQEKVVVVFLKALNIPFEKEVEILPAHIADGIRRGQVDVKEGRVIILAEFQEKRSIDSHFY